MRVLRFLIHVVLFLAVGEGLIRFDRATAFFRSGERLANEPKTSELLTAVGKGEFVPSGDELRVMVVGDSFLFGAGVPPAAVFSNQLAAELARRPLAGHARVTVLDVTRPGSNTYANKLDFLKYSDPFQPQVVVLAYNANDVYGDQGAAQGEPTPARQRKNASSGSRSLDLVASIRRLIFQSKLFEYVLQNVNMELKLSGIVLPGSEFDHLVNHSHAADFPGWIRSQPHLREIAGQARQQGIRLIVANVPELNMLPNYSVFAKVNATIGRFFSELGVEYVDLSGPFLEQAQEKYSISRYDGHPNGAAHKLIAHVVAARIANGALTTGAGKASAQARLESAWSK